MQRSGVGDPNILRSLEIPIQLAQQNVGANLHDQPMIGVERSVGTKLQSWLDEAALSGFLPEEQTLGKAMSSLATDGLYDLHLYPLCASDQTSELHGSVQIKVACLKPRSRVNLAINSKNPETLAAINHNYLGDADGHDLAVIQDGILMADDLLEHPELKCLLGECTTNTQSEAGIRDNVAHYYHPVGTCAMGLTDNDVCDEKGRVRDLHNVTVADASLIPQKPRANTNLPSVMIGERIAEILTY